MKFIMKSLTIALIVCTVNVPVYAMKNTRAAVTKKGPIISIFEAAKTGNLARIKELVEAKPERVNSKDSNNKNLTPIHYAAKNGHAHIVEYLIDKGARLDEAFDGYSSLEAAIILNRISVIKVLLEKGAQISTPALDAAMLNPEIFKILLDYIKDIQKPDKHGNTFIHSAALKGYSKIVELLFERGVNVDQETKGATPLFAAISEKHLETAELILRHNPDVNKFCIDFSPLHAAIFTNQKNIIALLIMHNVDFYKPVANSCIMPLSLINGQNIKEEVKAIVKNGALYQAAQEGNEEQVKVLLADGAYAFFKRLDGTTPIMIASEKGHTQIVEILIESLKPQLRGFAISDTACGYFNVSAVYLAAKHGHTEIVKLLLNNQGSPNVVTTDGWTPLMIAAVHGYTEIAEVLLSHGAHYTAKNSDGFTAHELASQEGHDSICKLIEAKREKLTLFEAVEMGDSKIEDILKENPNPINELNAKGYEPLFVAAMEGHAHTAQSLIAYGAQVNKKNETYLGYTPLEVAISREHPQVVRTLLEHNADTSNWTRALQNNASQSDSGCYEVIKSLIEHKINPNERCASDGMMPLAIAINTALYYNQFKPLQALLELGVDTNYVDKDRTTALTEPLKLIQENSFGKDAIERAKNIVKIVQGTQLFQAAQNNDSKTVLNLLTQEKIDANSAQLNGVTPLMIAAQEGHLNIVKALIAFKGNVNAKASGYHNVSALYLAAHKGNEEVVKLLLKGNADANILANGGTTPLMIAAYKGHTKTVEILLACGADKAVKKQNGKTANDLALKQNHEEVCKLLESEENKINTSKKSNNDNNE